MKIFKKRKKSSNSKEEEDTPIKSAFRHSYKISSDYFWERTESLGFMMKIIGLVFGIFWLLIASIPMYYVITRQMYGLVVPTLLPLAFAFLAFRRLYKYRFFKRHDAIDGHKFLRWHKEEMKKYEENRRDRSEN